MSIEALKNMDKRGWGKYDKPFAFNIAVQTLEEINND